MKIALLNTFDNGGAGKAALRLNKGLNSIGENSQMFVKWKNIDDETITQILSREINNKLFDELSMKYFIKNIKKGNTISSLMYPSVGFDYLNLFQSYDVVNLHWIPSFISIEAIVQLDRMQKPIIWTLHDENPYTGGCHYTHGCEKFKINCSNCPQLVTNPSNITKHILESKIKYLPKNITIVTPSIWLAETAKESALFKNHRVEVIANSLETDIYKPYKKSQLKRDLGLSENSKVLLFGAEDLNENRKGLSYLLDSINYMKQNNKINKLLLDNELHVLTFGKPSPILDSMDIPYKSLGYINNDERLAEIYSVADILALPSLEDNLPNMMLESLSCGTPVVAFNTGGIKDVIVEGYNGFLCEVGDSVSFANKIINVLFSDISFSENCREYAEEFFALNIQANKYKALFEDLINNKTNYFSSGNVPRLVPEISEPLMDWICDISLDIENQINKFEKDNIAMKNGIEELIKERDTVLAQSERLKEERNHIIIERENIKSERDSLVENTEKILHEIDILIAEKENLKQERDILLADSEYLRQERDSVVLEREHLKQEKDRVVAERESIRRELGNISEELHQAYGSRSWKFTKPLRFLGRKLK
ncbi:glycosyltransferase [Paenibacillus sp. SYP-B3998]|uniref:Glycosyltransferase n=1 Tax=Paenibacillus sp. SYP-B3998 TaxID=2678564 RepID=A0A6G3ZY66_9BACL|nr:glycosyltransferase [Paenibacillus sp. SYP-B3998]NEW07082.1 glycosyltransferase [Paenibacillus sp. SYP-B3998]